MYIHLNGNNKINDICNPLGHGHNAFPNETEYIETEARDLYIEDTWDFENNCSLKDSPIRFIIPPKTELEILQISNSNLKKKVKKLEKDINQLKKMVKPK